MAGRHTPKHSAAPAHPRRLRRSLRERLRRYSALTASAALVASTATVVAIASLGSTADATTPGSPGTPQAPTTLYDERFENNMGVNQVLLNAYTGGAPANATYTAANGWLTGCNGEIVEFNTPYTDLGNCTNTTNTSNTRQLAYALGAHTGAASPETNHAVTAYTEGNPGANAVEFETQNPLTLPSATGRFLTFSVDAAAVNCAVSAPQYQFYLMNGTTPTAVGGQINACSSPDTENVPAVGTLAARAVKVGTYTSNGSVLFNGSSLGIRMTNANGSGTGNDAAFDNVQVLDVTPQLDKAFSPTSVQVGQSTTLTFTITNTDELAAKNGWSFTDTLPAGMTVTTPAVTTTCPSGAITAPAGGKSIKVTGNLSAGMASCTVTAHVVAGTAGDYTNGPGNVTLTGLNPPGTSTVTYTAPTVDCATSANVFNTGYNAATGGVLANGANDPRWMVAGGYDGLYFPNGTSPATATPLPPAGTAFLPAQVGKVNNVWANSPYGNSQWISADYVSPANGQNQNAGSGDWYYQYQFNLDPAVDPSTFALSVKWLSDNSLASLWVNGTQKYVTPNTDPYHQGNLSAGTAVPLTLNSGWQNGLNTILVEVKSFYTAEGFDAQVQPSSLCPSITVTKDVTKRKDPSDQFTVSVSQAANTLTSVTTAGTQTTATSDPAYVKSGQTYTITDAMAAGSASSISDYEPAITCTDTTTGAAVAVNGTAPTWTLTAANPDAYACTVTNTPKPPVWDCTAFGYLFQTPDATTHRINQVDLVTGAAPQIGTTPDGVNAVGYNTLDNYIYGFAGQKLVRVGSDGTWTDLGTPAGLTSSFNVGDFDDAGHLWVTTSASGAQWAEIDLVPGSPTYGQVLGSGAAPAFPSPLVTPGSDWSWINGNLYSVGYSASFAQAYLTKWSPTTHAWSIVGTVPVTGTVGVGATFTDGKYLYASENSNGFIYRIDPTTRQTIKISNGPISGGNDGARCATAQIPTITVTKQVAGRVQAADQFTVGLKGPGGATQTSATTAGTQTSVSTTNWPVSQNATYTITDAMAAGSPDALSAYTATVRCTDKAGNTVTTGGTTGAWTLNVADPTDYTCVITNTPGTKSYTVTKSASTSGPVHPGDTITYTVVVQNTGPVPYTAAAPATATDNLAGVLDDATYNNDATNGATLSGTTLNWSGVLAPQGSAGDSVTITYSVTVNNPDAGDKDLKNVVVGGTNCPPGTTDPPCGTDTHVQSYRIVKSSTATQVLPGETVDYTITVTNTGSVDYTAADPASFTDDLTAVLDDAVYNNDATGGATYAAPVLSWSGALAVGDTVTITYSVTVNEPDTGDATLSNAVVTPPDGPCPDGSTNPDCNVVIPEQSFDVVKTASQSTADPGDTITYTLTVTNTGQADYTAAEPASLTDDMSAVLDDATYDNDATNGATFSSPKLSWSGPLAVGETVTITYSVTVKNPDTGDAQLRNVVTTPPGGSCAPGSTDPDCSHQIPVRQFKTSKKASTAQAGPGDTVTYTVTVTNTGQAAFTAADPAGFSDDLSAVLDDAVYNGDASASDGSAVTYSAPTLSWSGALPLGATLTITYTVTVNDPDTGDHSLENAVVPDGPGTCADGSLPPCDPTVVPVADYTVTKTSSAATATPGSTITYTVTVENTGDVAYTTDNPATFTDDMSGVLDDATYNDDATNGATFTSPNLTWSGALAKGQTITVTYSVTVNAPDTGDHHLKNAVVGGTNCPDGSTDADCGTDTPVEEYTVTKTASATAAQPGDTITYTVTVENTGQTAYTAADPATFSDDLSGVLDDATYNNDATNGATFAAPNLTWSGALAIAQSITVTYSVTVNDPDTGDHSLKNAVVGGQCKDGSTDPNCGTVTPVQDYTVAKTSSATTASAGDTVTYTVTVKNLGDVAYTAADPATFTDDLSAVVDDATYNGDATGGATYAAPILSWSGPLAVGETVTVTYSVTVNRPDTGDHELDNTVVGGTNCPVESTDPGCAPPPIPVGEYTVDKTASATTVHPGDTVTYAITVHNTGAIAYTVGNPATFTDNLSSVLDDATYNDDATGGATYAAPVLSWSGALGIGETITVTYSVTVDNPDAGDNELRNAVVPGDGGGCEDGSAPPCDPVVVPVQAFRTVKTVDKTEVVPGEKVTYTIKVINTGKAPYTAQDPASFTDDLSSVLDDATYDGDATSGASYAAPTLSWSGALDIGQTVTITYSVTVNDPDAGDKKLTNTVVTPPGQGGNCDGPMPARALAAAAPTAANNPDCTADVPGKQLTVKKTSSATTAGPGQKVTYTITVANTGQTDFTAAQPATLTDDLSGVLDDATYNGDASSGATVSGTTLAWSGPLAIGDTVAITYSVTINKPDAGDKLLKNVVHVPPEFHSNCTAGSTDPDCSTQTPVKQYSVVKKASSAKVQAGDTVTYTITVVNTGQAAYTADDPASYIDDLTNVLDDATYNDDATNGATYAAPKLSWFGPLPLGGTESFTYSVTVDDPDNGDGQLLNVVATPTDPGGVEQANCPAGTDDPDCSTETGVEGVTSPPPTAVTGNDTELQLMLGGLLLGAGGLLVLVGRRRRRTA